jgi:small subunit ribosomal protein S17
MKKTLVGIVVSLKMQKTAVVSLTSRYHHPLYRKLIKRDKRVNVDSKKFELKIGDKVRINETKPVSKTKNFEISEVIKK